MTELTVTDIESYYQQYGSSVLQRCRDILQEESAAWDAMHQTFVRAIRYRKSYRGQSSPRRWLFSISHRVCMDELQRRGRNHYTSLEDSPEPQDEYELPQNLNARLEQRRMVGKLLSLFNPKVQEVVVLRYFEELEVREISEETGLSPRTVARRLSQFLERSRKILKESRA